MSLFSFFVRSKGSQTTAAIPSPENTEEPAPKPWRQSLISDDNLPADAHNPRHFTQCAPELSEGVDAAEMKRRIEELVGKRQTTGVANRKVDC